MQIAVLTTENDGLKIENNGRKINLNEKTVELEAANAKNEIMGRNVGDLVEQTAALTFAKEQLELHIKNSEHVDHEIVRSDEPEPEPEPVVIDLYRIEEYVKKAMPTLCGPVLYNMINKLMYLVQTKILDTMAMEKTVDVHIKLDMDGIMRTFRSLVCHESLNELKDMINSFKIDSAMERMEDPKFLHDAREILIGAEHKSALTLLNLALGFANLPIVQAQEERNKAERIASQERSTKAVQENEKEFLKKMQRFA